MTKLRRKFINEMKLRNFSPNTIYSYSEAVAALSEHYNRSPDLISEDEIKQYILYMADDKGLSYSSCNVAFPHSNCSTTRC